MSPIKLTTYFIALAWTLLHCTESNNSQKKPDDASSRDTQYSNTPVIPAYNGNATGYTTNVNLTPTPTIFATPLTQNGTPIAVIATPTDSSSPSWLEYLLPVGVSLLSSMASSSSYGYPGYNNYGSGGYQQGYGNQFSNFGSYTGSGYRSGQYPQNVFGGSYQQNPYNSIYSNSNSSMGYGRGGMYSPY